MQKKIIWSFLGVIVIAGATAFALRFSENKISNTVIEKTLPEMTQSGTEQTISQDASGNRLFVAGWIPYWKKTQGADSLDGNLKLFSEINPFAFGVNDDGTLSDKMKLQDAPWPKLFSDAKQKNVAVVPTILWGDAKAMHQVFSDAKLADTHASAIVYMLESNNFSGVDIDYEGKDVADRDAFTRFIKTLKTKLDAKGKSLNCTIEARTQDVPPEGFSGTRAMSWANDFKALGELCGSVSIMAYDQVFQIHRANSFDTADDIVTAPNAANDWVEENIQYALKFISADKLVLGIPTYGWEFTFQKISNGFHYDRFQSVVFPTAMDEAMRANASPVRNVGGELSFVYQSSDGQHIVTFADAESVREKIEIAKNYNLKGVRLFKLDGQTDPKIFDVLAQ